MQKCFADPSDSLIDSLYKVWALLTHARSSPNQFTFAHPAISTFEAHVIEMQWLNESNGIYSHLTGVFDLSLGYQPEVNEEEKEHTHSPHYVFWMQRVLPV